MLSSAHFVPGPGPGISIGGKFLKITSRVARSQATHPAGLLSYEDLIALLRGAEVDGPVVLLVDDADAGTDALWHTVFGSFVRTELSALPILIVTSVEASKPPTDKEESCWRAAAERLVASRLAIWKSLLPLEPADIAAFVGDASSDVLQELYGLSAGNGQYVVDLWHEWRHKGYVVWDRVWRFQAGLDFSWRRTPTRIADAVLQRVFRGDGQAADDALKLLTYGALQGRMFPQTSLLRSLVGTWIGRQPCAIRYSKLSRSPTGCC